MTQYRKLTKLDSSVVHPDDKESGMKAHYSRVGLAKGYYSRRKDPKVLTDINFSARKRKKRNKDMSSLTENEDHQRSKSIDPRA